MNSLDVLPNSLPQVARSINAKLHRSPRYHRRHRNKRSTSASSSNHPPLHNLGGRAFAAPRDRSLDQACEQQDNLRSLAAEFERSSPQCISPSIPAAHQSRPSSPRTIPRKSSRLPSSHATSTTPHRLTLSTSADAEDLHHRPFLRRMQSSLSSISYRTPPSNRKARTFDAGEYAELRSRLRRARSRSASTSRENDGAGSESGSVRVQKADSELRGLARGSGAMSAMDTRRGPELTTPGERDGAVEVEAGEVSVGTGLRDFRARLEASRFKVEWPKGKRGRRWWERSRPGSRPSSRTRSREAPGWDWI